MSENAPLPLAARLAALSAELRAPANPHAGPSGPAAPLHALVLAVLLRLLAVLTAFVARWEAGLIPKPSHASRPVQRRPISPHTAATPRAARNRARPPSAQRDLLPLAASNAARRTAARGIAPARLAVNHARPARTRRARARNSAAAIRAGPAQKTAPGPQRRLTP